MQTATTTGASPNPRAAGAGVGAGAGATHREHKQGNQERKYTVEQKTAVIRVRRCAATAFYDILGLEEVRRTATDGDIKKAYRKLSLLTHPDKNGYEGADEAFKSMPTTKKKKIKIGIFLIFTFPAPPFRFYFIFINCQKGTIK